MLQTLPWQETLATKKRVVTWPVPPFRCPRVKQESTLKNLPACILVIELLKFSSVEVGKLVLNTEQQIYTADVLT